LHRALKIYPHLSTRLTSTAGTLKSAKGAIPDAASKHATKCTEIKRRSEKSGVTNGPYGLE
jgi:hypothetical protein